MLRYAVTWYQLVYAIPDLIVRASLVEGALRVGLLFIGIGVLIFKQ